MAENTVLSVIATTASRLSGLAISNGQLIFVQDKGRIALDFNDARVFYNQIVELETDNDRTELEAPINGVYYFVLATAILWTYQDAWVQITTQPDEIVSFGYENPTIGSENVLYVDKTENNISYWNTLKLGYEIVGARTESISNEDIENLFN